MSCGVTVKPAAGRFGPRTSAGPDAEYPASGPVPENELAQPVKAVKIRVKSSGAWVISEH